MVTGEPAPKRDRGVRVHIEERFLASKTGKAEDNEDAIHISDSFVAVIDGATSKTARLWQGRTSGQLAAHLLHEALGQLPEDATLQQAIEHLSEAIRGIYMRDRMLEMVASNPVERITASLAMASLRRKEVWLIGDCACIVGGRRITNRKAIDRVLAEARSAYLESELLRGKSIDDLRAHDTGREFIFPLLERQTLFQNTTSANAYSYAVLDGFPIPTRQIRICPIPPAPTTVVLATDGYPALHESLAVSERALQRIIERDPLLMRQYKSTKGVQAGNISYDDRAFVRFSIVPAAADDEETGR